MSIIQRLRANPWVVLVVLCLGLFMALLDTTIVNVAVPSIIEGIDASFDEILCWIGQRKRTPGAGVSCPP